MKNTVEIRGDLITAPLVPEGLPRLLDFPIIVAGWNLKGDAVELAFFDPQEDLWSRLCQAEALLKAARKLARAEAVAFANEAQRVGRLGRAVKASGAVRLEV